MKLFKNDANGAIVEVIASPDETIELSYNGTPMRQLKPGETDGAGEKHVPALSLDKDQLKVQVGEVVHPMLENHYITNIWAEYPDGTVEKISLNPGDEPVAIFNVDDVKGIVKVYEYCNLHGLWVNEIEVK